MGSDRQLFEGRYSDGQSARSIRVHGEMRADALVFWPADRSAEDAAPMTWTYATISTADNLRSDDSDVLVHDPSSPGASLYVTDRTFIRSLARRATHTSPRAWLWRFTKPALAILAVLSGLVGAVYLFDLSPARALASQMPQAMRERMAASLLKNLTKNRKQCTSPAGDAALRAMVQRVGGDLDMPLNVRVIDWKLQNAFALPGGNVVLTRGLLTNAASATEVAGVLAHEIGHVVYEHPETGLVRALGFIVAAQFIFAGGSETVGNIGTAIVALRFNRAAEVEADRYGLDLMKQRAIDPRPLAGFFRRLTALQTKSIRNKNRKDDDKSEANARRKEEAERKARARTSKSLEWISTHPATAGRIARIEAAPDYATQPVLTSSDWAALRNICGASGKKKYAD